MPGSGKAVEEEAAGGDVFYREAFFQMLADDDHALELRSWPPHKPTPIKRFVWTAAKAEEIAARLIEGGFDVHVGMAPRLGKGDGQRAYAPLRVLVTDHDTERSVRKLELFEPAPTAIVLSGNFDGETAKRHAYWALREPLAADQARAHLRRLAHHLEADMGSTDAAHVFRVPGSRHRETGGVASLLRFTGEVVDLKALTGGLPDPPAKHPATEHAVALGHEEVAALFAGRYREGDHRHDIFRSVCGHLLRKADRLPPSVLRELAICWAQAHMQPSRDRAELERNFDNLLVRERARRGLP